MKKCLIAISVFFLIMGAVYGQGSSESTVESADADTGTGTAQAASPVLQMDKAVKALAGDLHKKIIENRAGKIAVGQFVYRTSIPPLGSYWVNQLSGELSNIPNRSYIIVSGGPAGADWTVSGEIVEVADIVRVYTRLVRSEDRAIEGAFNTDLEKSAALAAMLLTGEIRSAPVALDEWEIDSWENPATYEIGVDENAFVMMRTFHDENDEDFFLLIPERDGRLVAETTGNIDTYMRFYNADSPPRQEELASNDDGGSGFNAKIGYNVLAGRRYMAVVSGYSGEKGQYGFRAYLTDPVQLLPPDEYENDDDSSSAKWIEIGTSQQHSFHHTDDVDWVKFQVSQPGRYVIRTRGVNSNRLDTCIELYDANMNSIAEDDDGGEDMDSRLSLQLDSGLYYLKVWCLDYEPDQAYTISIEQE